jgi:nitrite reductase/ring-hydroxylating ferredoxin subunit
MADRTTPFIFDEWYVAAFSAEVGRTLLKRKILGRNIVIFRAESGRVVALDDRCAHRSFPLSRGRLEGDTLVCGYHGFRYDTQGDCIQIPSQARTTPDIRAKIAEIGSPGIPLTPPKNATSTPLEKGWGRLSWRKVKRFNSLTGGADGSLEGPVSY